MCDLIKILAAAAHPVPLRKLRMTLAYAVLGTFVLICAPTLAGAQALMSPKPSAVAETPTQGGPGVGVQKTFREASVKAGPNLHCKLHERGRDPTTGITVHTDADGFARFQAVQGGQASAQQLSCKTDSGVASNYPVDLDSPQLFVSRPRDLAKEPGIERPALTGDPASYTQAQLSKLGYGLRPDRSASIYADWLTAASHPARILTVKRSNENHHSVTPVTGGAWIGSVLAGAAPYDWVMATFVVPKAVPGADGTNLTAASIWPGLGGFNTGSGLIQAGVGIQTTPSTASYSTWREYCCGDGDSNGYAGAFAPSPGDKILAQAWYCDSNGQVDINGGYGCSYVYDFASRAAFSCTSPKTGANDPPCWSVKALPTCATNPTAQNCMTLGHNAEFIMENQSPQISQAADQFPKYEPALKMSGYAHSASKGAVTLADDPSVVLLKDYPHRPPHVLVSISALGDTLMDEDPVLPVVAKQSFSVSRNFLQSDFGKQGNFELLAPQGNMIGQYYRDNNDPKLLWHFVRNFGYQGGRVPRAVTFMQSNYKGDGTHGNFEAVVRVSEQGKPDVLDFWFLNSKSFQWSGPFALLADGKQVSGVTGNPVLIQNSWGHQGNFELLVPQGNVIGEYFRDNDDAQPSWHHSRDFGYAGSPRFPVGVSFMQSNYKGDAVHGNLEAVVRVAEAGKADVLDFWYLDSRAGRWSGPFGLVADGRQATAVGDPALIQSSWGSPGNFELLVPSNGGISRYFRDNNGAGGGWHRMSDLSYPPNRSARSVALVQSNFLGDWFHGNFEVVARVAEPGKPDSLDFWFFDTQTQKWSFCRNKRRVSCAVTIRTIGRSMKTLNPAMARVLKRLHYPLDVILTCVRWYVAYPLSLRHLEEMMAERGISVDHSTVHRWAVKLLPVLEKAFRRHKKPVGRSWRMDETYIKVRGQWKYLYRAVDKEGNTVDFLLRAHRDKAAARRYFEKSIDQNGEPETVTIDKSGANLAALDALNAERETPIKIRQDKYLNNVVEQDHRAIKRRTRPMLGFKSFRCARILLAGIEVMHMIAKGQMKCAFGTNPSAVDQFYDLAT